MSTANSETLEKILETGKKEFLEKGFKGVSLRRIAFLCGVTTGAIYGYFPDKESLFSALVKDHADKLMSDFLNYQIEFDQLPNSEKADLMDSYSRDNTYKLLHYVYDHMEPFQLIFNCSEGTQYVNYLDRLIAIEEEYTFKFLESLKSQGQKVPSISKDVMHIICSACFTGMFEVVCHDIPREEAFQHIELLNEFFRAGWAKIMEL